MKLIGPEPKSAIEQHSLIDFKVVLLKDGDLSR